MSVDTAGSVLPLEVDAFLEEASRRTGLNDFGPQWFTKGMSVFFESARTEAQWTAEGRARRTEYFLHGLSNRLNMFDWIKRHPEILDEKVPVAGIVVGLPRTGSTMVHRLLDAGPNMTAMRMWENIFLAPMAGEGAHDTDQRVAIGQQAMAEELRRFPQLAAMHPPVFDGAEEEILLMEQWFIGTGVESQQWVPGFGDWHIQQNLTDAYRDLYTSLQFLQWQRLGRKNCSWVLKSPGHLADIHSLLSVFPDAKIINTHRDPLSTIPSYASMMEMFYGMHSDAADPTLIGPYWAKRWGQILSRYLDARREFPDDRFIDVQFRDVIGDKLEQVRMIFERMGRPLDAGGVAAIEASIAADPHASTAKHHYTMERFGLTQELIENEFAAYRARFIDA